ncbi:hypothetical protein CALCODRAFT_49830 [Calocera cornea HHB12733]|uniref:C2H2-type domain-containing protein n=1 Tax=Calocera cornea HHB12733 TaxID=1353952 RepID=A0A165DTN3_9BASI|nr:hypothetical protein CALCODRAFT_49830 [Calocera cornea HHB12733]
MQWEGTSPPTPALFDAWPAVEQNYCKDFTCCGLELPGLHELLQHYEERHVQHQQFSDDESMLTSPITPLTSSPRSSVGPEGPATPPPSSFPYSPTDMKFSYPPYAAYPVSGFYNPEFPVSEPYTAALPHVPSLVPEYDVMQGFDPLDHDSPAYSVPPSLVNKPLPQKPQGLGITIPSIDTKELTAGPLAGRKVKYGKDRKSKKDDELPEGQKRVKPFKCKVPGCTKAYLNSNGLRYHMQKGTCVLSGPAPEDA